MLGLEIGGRGERREVAGAKNSLERERMEVWGSREDIRSRRRRGEGLERGFV